MRLIGNHESRFTSGLQQSLIKIRAGLISRLIRDVSRCTTTWLFYVSYHGTFYRVKHNMYNSRDLCDSCV